MDKMDRYEQFSLQACRARIAELEAKLAATRAAADRMVAALDSSTDSHGGNPSTCAACLAVDAYRALAAEGTTGEGP